MTLAADDLGVLGDLAVALGLFGADGSPNADWFSDPEDSLGSMLANDVQREALIGFVDEALGGADRDTDPSGVIWLPIVALDDSGLSVSVTVAETSAGIDVGVGLSVHTTDPNSKTTLSVPLFRTRRENGPPVTQPLLLGSNSGRIRVGTSITIDATPPVPGEARLGAIGIDVDIPTSPGDPVDPVFGLSLTGFQLPGAASPSDIRVSADGVDQLDDAVLDLVLSLLRSAAESATSGSLVESIGGLLGLLPGDDVLDFPIAQIPVDGVHALAEWVHAIITSPAARTDWIGYLAGLVGGTTSGDSISFDLGGAAALTVGLTVDTGPSGNTRLTPTLAVELGNDDARVEAQADLFQIDLVTGSAIAFPQLGVWAAVGRPGVGNRVLDVTGPPVTRADTLRLGFALDPARRLTFVLAADGVTIGSNDYPTLDLTSPDAVMDAVGNTLEDVANELLGHLGDALAVARSLLGLDPPTGVDAVTLTDLLTDPLRAVGDYWNELVTGPVSGAAVPAVLAELRDAVADATSAVASIHGTGTPSDPWRVELIGPLELEAWTADGQLALGVAAVTRVDTLGERCTVVETRFAATIVTVDLAARSASVLPGIHAALTTRERGIDPPRVTLALPGGLGGTSLTASGVGLRLEWTPDTGLGASIDAPNLTLNTPDIALPITLPTVAADGSVTLPPEAWDGLEAFVGYLGDLLGATLGEVVTALGWTTEVLRAGGDASTGGRLRLADLIADPVAAIGGWLPEFALSNAGERALDLVADLFGGGGVGRGFVVGSGHPDDPYRVALDDGVPNIAVWFPPAGLEPRTVPAPGALQRWRPGDPALPPRALADALVAESSVAADVRELVEGRDVAGGLTALITRWVGGDGRIAPPTSDPGGVNVVSSGVAAGQLLGELDLDDLIGRTSTTTVFVALGADAWPGAPAERSVDLTAAGLAPEMFSAPAPAEGEWFVALGTREACRGAASPTDGTPEQAARLARVLDSIATVSSEIAIVAVAGAGHAARVAAEAQVAVTDLVTLGTPLAPIALTAISSQPTADALRLLHRLMPAPPSSTAPPDDEDLALGRGLVAAMMELTTLADPSTDLRPATSPTDTPRAGLSVAAVFGVVDSSQVGQAVTAIVAAGLAARARLRATVPVPDPTGVGAGLRLVVAPSTQGTLSVSGDALLTLLEYDSIAGIDTTPELRVRVQLADRVGWLVSEPDLELRMVTADVSVRLDGTATGVATVTLHDARVFGQSWERLVLGLDAAGGAVPVLPEARTLLAAAVQRLAADVGAPLSVALAAMLEALGVVAAAGGVVGDAVDQLVHDPGGLIRQRLAAHRAEIGAAIAVLLGPAAPLVDLDTRSLRIVAGSDTAGRFGWRADVTFSPTGLAGQVQVGKDAGVEPFGGLGVLVDLDTAGATPLVARLLWHRSGGSTDVIELWPAPDAAAIARTIAASAPSLGGQVAVELLRRADDAARPIVDAALDALGLLEGTVGSIEARVRPVAGLLADPAGWLRSSASLASEPARIQSLFDALRPLLGVAGVPGSPLPLATGVALSVRSAGAGARLELSVDPTGWVTPAGVDGRLAIGVTASVDVAASGPPGVALATHIGLTGVAPGRQAVHLSLGSGGASVFLRPTSGPDIPLLPFAGLGSLAAVAEAALPFVLDRLAEIPGDVGLVVGRVGDALALRVGSSFDGQLLHDWAVDPVGSLVGAVPSIVAIGLTTIAPLLDAILPAGVAVTATADDVTVTIGDVTATWDPIAGRVRLAGDGLTVPGVDEISFTIVLAAVGLDEVSVTVGPASIDVDGVTLRPFVSVAAGASPVGGRRVAIGLAIDDDHRFAARWMIDAGQFDLVASEGAISAAIDSTDPVAVALAIVDVIADLVASVALGQPAVQDLLDTVVGSGDVRDLLEGVVLEDGDTTSLITGMFDLDTLLARFQRMFENIAGVGISINVDGFTLSILEIDDVVGVQVGLTERFALLEGDVSLWLENDDSWIDGNPSGTGGLFVGILRTAPLRFTPSLVVNGVGLRIGKTSGPLLDFGVTLDSVALHVYAEIDGSGPRSGGVQIQLANLAVGMDGAQGDNGIAQGIMSDTGSTPPQPAFSPALAIQKHGNGPVGVALRAGDGDGPWWIAIQKGFGPLYLEQIGFGAEMQSGRLTSISLLMDGSISMFGLTCAVDDLSITYFVANGDFFNSANWAIDLAGLAVSADMAGLTISGGLLKQTTDQGIEYLGMLLARFGVYGITIYGGYGEGVDNGEKFTAFFAVGAINGPIGGPPAFFLTGIGGGFGINRALIVPTDLSQFGDYPLIKALDIAAKPQNPMDELRSLGTYFPMEKGTFWFAAGLSFTSFALVDGIAVVAVEIGDGLDINLLGLARMALPRPQVALVSIEVALLVRFSSSEGVLWVQGQLTDNSWLLYPDIKLTGGFAFVIWFKGEHRGEFVLTLGGYHPDFKRSGYPVVPRLGLRWSIGSSIVIEAGSYFALTSEALMAGGDFHASAQFGPAWAEVKFGAHGIVYFDPFRYQINVYARISAGVTIDTWIFGEITISISIGARIDVTGPDFHGKATFEVGPIELTVEFGGSDKSSIVYLSGSAFVDKYLDPAEDGSGALAHAAMTSFGALPSKGEDATPDGSSARPFIVVVEFGLTFTSEVPATRVSLASAPAPISNVSYPPSKALGVAPMGPQSFDPVLNLTWLRGDDVQHFPFVPAPRPFGAFPSGIFGQPQDMDNRKVPKAEMIEALNELDLVSLADESPGGPEIPYYQVEIGKRKPLPFSRRTADINRLKSDSAALAALVDGPDSVSVAFASAQRFLAQTATPTALASLRGERQAPPLLGTLAERLDIDAITVVPTIGERPPGKVYDHFVDAPVAVGLLSGAAVDLRTTTATRTTVEGSARLWRTSSPTIASVEASRSRSIATRLVIGDQEAVSTRRGREASRGATTVIGAVDVPPSATAHSSAAIVARAGGSGADHLNGFTSALTGNEPRRPRQADGRLRTVAPVAGATLQPGQLVVLKLPNAAADVTQENRPKLGVAGAPARVVTLSHGGGVMRDEIVGGRANAAVEVERGTERIVVVGQGASRGPALDAGLVGWHAGMQLPYVGWTTAIAPGCVVRALGEPLAQHRERLEAGWIEGAELTRGASTVTTRFSAAVSTVVVIIDDPAAFGDPVDGRQLLLGLDGATRATDAGRVDLPPVVLAMENRSVLAYDVVPTGDRAVAVTVSSQLGWSLVGVMGSSDLTSEGAVALISTRGLDAAVQPFAAAPAGVSNLAWKGRSRTDGERATAKALASGRPGVRLQAIRAARAAERAENQRTAEKPTTGKRTAEKRATAKAAPRKTTAKKSPAKKTTATKTRARKRD